MNESRQVFEWVMSHEWWTALMWTRHGTCMDDMHHTRMIGGFFHIIWGSFHNIGGFFRIMWGSFMAHVRMTCITHEPSICGWVMSHTVQRTLQHTGNTLTSDVRTHCNTLQHTLQHTLQNTLQHTLQHALQHALQHTLQHTLQHARRRTHMAHVWMTCVTHEMMHVIYTNESCHTDEWVMSHIRMNHVTQMNELCHTHEEYESWHMYEWRASHTNQVSMHQSCHTH